MNSSKPSRVALLLLLACGACAGAEIPYDYARVEVRRRPVHPLEIAVLPFDDGRDPSEGDDSADSFIYRGVEYDHTDLTDLRRGMESVFPEIMGRHLVRAGLFSKVILVNTEEDAPEADLFLHGTVERARGYVEVDSDRTERRPGARRVLAELVLRVRIERTGVEGALVDSEIGWSIFGERPDEPLPTPWSVLGEAMLVANGQLEDILLESDLSGGLVVRDKVKLASTNTATTTAFGLLESEVPYGWRSKKNPQTSPEGWNGDTCDNIDLEALQTQYFHRVLGPYRPSVRVWACPKAVRLRYDHRADFPARYLGVGVSGRHYFVQQLGRSNWMGAEKDIRRHLVISPPEERHVFQLGQ